MGDGVMFTGFKKVIATNENGEEVPALLIFYSTAKQPQARKNRSPLKRKQISSPTSKKNSGLGKKLRANSSENVKPTTVTSELNQSVTSQVEELVPPRVHVSTPVETEASQIPEAPSETDEETSFSPMEDEEEHQETSTTLKDVPTSPPPTMKTNNIHAEPSFEIDEQTPFTPMEDEEKKHNSSPLLKDFSASLPPLIEDYNMNAASIILASRARRTQELSLLEKEQNGPAHTPSSPLTQACESAIEIAPIKDETSQGPVTNESENFTPDDSDHNYVHKAQGTTMDAQDQPDQSQFKHVSVVREGTDDTLMELCRLEQKCLLCANSPKVYPTRLREHFLNVHFKHSVKFKDLKSLACKLMCIDEQSRVHYHCAHCFKIFRKKYLLDEHYNSVDRKNGKDKRPTPSSAKREQCSVCSVQIQSKHMKRHMKTHMRQEMIAETENNDSGRYEENDGNMDTGYNTAPTVYIVTQPVE